MNKIPISYVELSMCLEDKSREELEYYLDRETGNIIKVDCFLMQKWEAGEETTHEDFPDFQKEEYDAMISVLKDSEGKRYHGIPRIWPKNENRIIDDFINTIDNEQISEKLRKILKRPRAIMLIKDELFNQPGMLESYYRFEEKEYRKLLEDWVKSLLIEPEWK